jgi:hypothetical protein
MESTGVLKSVNRDWTTGKIIISFQLNEEPTEAINDIQSCEKLSIKAVKYREKRSLDANAYCWEIITKIANHPDIKSSKEEVYEEMLQKYGYLYQDEDGYIPVTVKTGVNMSKIEGHWKFYKSNGKFDSYLMIKGSSEYDSKEMAHFIDCVVQEAKELGIETLTPVELERLKTEWGKTNGK